MFLTSCLLQSSDFTDYLGLEDEISVPMMLLRDLNLFEDDLGKLERIPARIIRLEFQKYPPKDVWI